MSELATPQITDVKFDQLTSLVRGVGQEILKLWPGNGNKSLKITNKLDNTPVTEADLLADKLIVEGLGDLFPNDKIISEESGQGPGLTMNDSVWIIDPIDGTRSFMNGKDTFSILIGRCRNGYVDMGILYFPVTKIMAWAIRGRGAYVDGARISVSTSTNLHPAKTLCAASIPINPCFSYEKFDAGHALLRLAMGQLDGIVLDRGVIGMHDLAAGSILIEEAGGSVSDELGNSQIFHPDGFRCSYLVASNRSIHSDLLRLLM